MRKISSLLFVAFVVLVWMNRQRIYLRDPLAVVEKAGVKQTEARVFINYSSDVLVQDGVHWVLVQGWSGVAGVPAQLNCLQGLACMTEADHAEVTPVGKQMEMSNRVVRFVDGGGTAVRVMLR